MQAHLHDPSVPFTLTHGDFHAANMLWCPERAAATEKASRSTTPGSSSSGGGGSGGGGMVLVDWSEVGVWEPMADIAQMLVSDVRPHVRRQCERALIATYVATLRDAGVTSYSAEAAWRDYGRAGSQRWLWLFAVLAGLPDEQAMPLVAARFFHDQTAAFVRDHASATGAGPLPLTSVVCMVPR